MRRIKQIITVMMILMAMLTANVLPVISKTAIAQAATIVTGEREFKLKVGEAKTLSIKGTGKITSWKSSNKAVASVSDKGKVLAVKEGIAVITANVSGKKFNYTVTVYHTNPYLDKAKFKAVEVLIGEISFVIPKDMKFTGGASESGYEGNGTIDSGVAGYNISIYTGISELEARDYEEMQEYYKDETLESLYDKYVTPDGAEMIELSDYKRSDYSSPNGKVYRREYMLNHTTKIIDFYQEFDHFNISVSVSDSNDMGLDSIAKFILDSAKPLPQ